MQVLVELYLGIDPIPDEGAPRAGACGADAEEIVGLDGGGFAGEGPEQALILFHADYKGGIKVCRNCR